MSVNPEAGGGLRLQRSSDDRRGDRYDDYRDYDSPERERERRNSDRSEDGYHSDGDYGEHDYRHDISDERESKTIMLRGLPITITESDIREMMESFEGPQPADVRLMKRENRCKPWFRLRGVLSLARCYQLDGSQSEKVGDSRKAHCNAL